MPTYIRQILIACLWTIYFAGAYTSALAQNTISWGKVNEVSSSERYGNNFPRIELSRKGKPVVLWGDGQNIFLSTWTDSSFSSPKQINPRGVVAAAQNWMGPDIAANGDTVYIVYKQIPASDTNNHVWLRTSLDGGNNFGTPVQVDHIGSRVSRFPTVGITKEGHPVVGFMEFSSGWLDAQWMVARSTDYGQTFSKPVQASGWSGSGSEACDCCPSKIVASNGYVVMPYRDNKNNIRDIWAGLSKDNGKTFNVGFAVDQLNWSIPGCPSSGPDGVIVGDTLITTFMSSAEGRGYVYLSKTDLTSGNDGQVIDLDHETPNRLVSQNYPRIAYDDDALAIVWKQIASSKQQIAIQFTEKLSAGLNTTQAVVTEGFIQGLDVAMDMGKIWVVWEDDASKSVKFISGSYIGNLPVAKITQQNIEVYPNPSSNTWTVNLTSKTAALDLWLHNVNGRLVEHIEHAVGQATIGDASLPRGVYYLTAFEQNTIHRTKLIKQ